MGVRVVVAGGGSGGHIYPALAIAREIRRRDADSEVLYIGGRYGMEQKIVPRDEVAVRFIHARGLLVPGWPGKVRGIWSALRGLGEAWSILRGYRPDVVVGTGGYVAGPVGLAALMRGVPLVLQEQNAWPGLTTRLLGRRARRVLIPYPEARRYFRPGTRLEVAGNPVTIEGTPDRAAARRRLGIAPEWTMLMATGGSQGAAAINRFLLEYVPTIVEQPTWGLLWATGTRYHQEVMDAVAARLNDADRHRIQIVPYFNEIRTVYRAADLYFGRAGAMTLTECAAFGLPQVLVPSPYVAEDHQSRNAELAAKRGAAVVIGQDRLDSEGGALLSGLYVDDKRRQAMGAAAATLYDPDAVAKIVAAIANAVRDRRGR